jgi:divalent metal cation (Fe/Co/Zn/Cd) transporter
MIQHKDWKTRHQFPVGKARLEPLGVLVFSVIMIVSFIQVASQAVARLVEEQETHTIVRLNLSSIIIMSATGILTMEVD